MTLFSIKFLIFLIVVFVIFYLLPYKYGKIWLLIASYAFYASWSVKCVLILALVTLISYFISRLISGSAHAKAWLATGIGLTLFILIIFKFWNIWALGMYTLFGIADPVTGGIMSIVAPVGLSFYVLESIGYLYDVYSGKISHEKNILNLALFLSFFPNVLSGPIERGSGLLKQIRDGVVFSYDKVRHGLCLMLWGYFLKLLIANRLAFIVDAAFSDLPDRTGFVMLIAAVFYGIQLYADFAGYSCLAIGMAETLGFTLTPNFRQPYFAKDIRDFWSRWHISLSTWLRDYVYIPLGGNRKGKVRQFINLFITFLVSGLWHGTGWQFMVWGCLHGIYQIASRLFSPVRIRLTEKCRVNTECVSFRVFQAIMTFIFVDIAWIFFRAGSVHDALSIGKKIICYPFFWQALENNWYLMDYDEKRFFLLILELLVVLAVDIIHEKKISITAWLNAQNKAFRWLVYLTAALILVLGVIRDYGIEASTFIYTQF